MLSVSVGRAVAGHGFRLVAFVYMPEHVHLLVFPGGPGSRVSGLLKAAKQPFSNRIKQLLVESSSGLVDEASRWRWSSCRWYAEDGRNEDEALPAVDPLPAEFWDDTG